MRPTTGGLDVESLAAASPGFSGADLAHLVETASDEAIVFTRASRAPIALRWAATSSPSPSAAASSSRCARAAAATSAPPAAS